MTTEDRVIFVLKELSGIETISLSDVLLDDLKLDSLSMVALLLEIEDAFDFELKESDMNPFDLNTVADVLALVTRYTEAQNGKSS